MTYELDISEITPTDRFSSLDSKLNCLHLHVQSVHKNVSIKQRKREGQSETEREGESMRGLSVYVSVCTSK